MLEKQEVLNNAEGELNKEDQPWSVKVEGDKIIATWKWMDATFFAVNEARDEDKEYEFIVTLKDDGKWKEEDKLGEKFSKLDFKDGKLSFGSSSFSGTSVQKNITIGFGKNNATGEVGIIKAKFDTSIIKKAVRDYLINCGWKKAGLFG